MTSIHGEALGRGLTALRRRTSYRLRRSAHISAASPIETAERALPVAVMISAGVMILSWEGG